MQEEIDRIYNVCNMQITMHSILQRRYNRRSLFVNIATIVITFSLNILLFANLNYISKKTNVEVDTLMFYRSICSVTLFILVLININFRWADLSRRHQDAKNRLSNIYSKCRYYWQKRDTRSANKLAEEIIKDYNTLHGFIIEIPNSEFNYLKSKHLRKKEFSKFISDNPGIPFIFQRYQFYKKNKND